ncbi:hypothetical protein CQ12_06325 [Bradyrhizobium jicamae]|uniref:DUF3616 domain-containing protein n=1 Tax=Bradyrhizobium jicamae TaxID=280332 RepID=A0A0R3LQG7_9BRAD|nr:DUF3616 domain-containing protein [Bradyrhizobium jicamae]KRR10020.1 hypothetical protein CQ12_06325 [Bradyrhizobium jicamae]
MFQFIPASRLLAIATLSTSLTFFVAAAQAADQITTYRGACDGSAAIALDQNFFAVADDESNVLNVYRMGQAAAVHELSLDAFLEAPTKKKPGPDGEPVFKEADLEGVARIDDRIYWIASHARDSKGEAEPGRSRLFATRIVPQADGPRLEPIGSGAYKDLREAMFDDAKLKRKLKPFKLSEAYAPGKEEGPAPESKKGFNIEGLAATPDGRLLIGFRNPRPGKKALVISLDNPAEVVDAGKTPVFGNPWQLGKLKGRGIRSIEWVNNTYVIVAGPHGEAKDSEIKPPFALFTWSGKERDTEPVMMNAKLPDDFAPEAVFAIPGSSNMMLLSDDGTKKCKDADKLEKSFRALTLPAPK